MSGGKWHAMVPRAVGRGLGPGALPLPLGIGPLAVGLRRCAFGLKPLTVAFGRAPKPWALAVALGLGRWHWAFGVCLRPLACALALAFALGLRPFGLWPWPPALRVWP